MSFRETVVHAGVIGVTILFALLRVARPELLESAQYGLLILGTLLIGIPQGATDHSLLPESLPGSVWQRSTPPTSSLQ